MQELNVPKKYQFKDQTLFTKPKDVDDDRIEVEIGDSKQPDFKPQFKLMRWDNEVNFSIRAEEKPGAVVEADGDIIKYKTKDYEVHQYEKPDAGEDGGFEFEWVLNKKPKSNVLNATIQTKELNFLYQPELTKEEINAGSERPENVVGSYAVYHKTQKNNRVGGKSYKTGKAFHIYRPKAIDSKGKETWCELNIDEQSGILSVTVPQQFLNKASYPVTVDPTFGYTSSGDTNNGLSTDVLIGQLYSLSEDGIITEIAGYYRENTTSSNIKTAIYDHSGSYPNNRKVVSSSTNISGTSVTLYTFTTTSTSLSNGSYWLVAVAENTGTFLRYDYFGTANSDNAYDDTAGNYSSPPDPFPGDTLGGFSWLISIYATYTANVDYSMPASKGTVSLTGVASNLVPSGGSPLIDDVSGTDAGFENNDTPADTDPFNSGDQICYTVQGADELDAGTTYYWRVRVKDPSGSDTWSEWTTTRSFTTSTAYNITASVGTFSLNGANSIFNIGRNIAAAVGSFILSGIDSVLNIGRNIAAAVGNFTLTGISSTLLFGKRLAAEVGSFTLTGISIVFKNSLTLIASLCSFTLTGFASSLRRGVGILAEKATFILTGVNVALRAGVALTANVGAFTLTGIAATLNKGKTIVADAGSFVLGGVDVVLNIGIKITADVGSFALSGIASILRYGRSMAAAVGSFTLSGIASTFNRGINLVASTGQFILTGIVIRVPEWFNKIKNSSIWSNSSKNSSSFTNQSKSSSTWTNQNKS